MLKGLLDLMDLVCSLAIPAMLGDHFLKKFFSPLSVKMDVVLKVFVSYQQAERAERWHHCPHSGRSPLQDTGLARKQ